MYTVRQVLQRTAIHQKLELSENLTISPALALPKHMAGILDEKCREKEKYREEQIGECPFSIPRYNLSL